MVAAIGLSFSFPHGGSGTVAGGTSTSGTAPKVAIGNPMPGMDMGSNPASTASAAQNIARDARDVGTPITRTAPATVNVDLTTKEVLGQLDGKTTYRFWTFGGTVPGPMLRVMQGDTLVIHLHNDSSSLMPHSIDFHAASGPGGGAGVSQTLPGKDSTFSFKALSPGLYIYHCATQPVSMHIADGMYGMLLVEPPGGLPKVDHEFYLVQSEFYTQEPRGTAGEVHYSASGMMDEHPTYYVFNGKVGSMVGPAALHASVGQTIRMFVGVGAFESSNFHVIGNIFSNVYEEGALGNTPLHNVQTTLVPAGGSTIVEFSPQEPGTYVFVDHSMSHMDKGAMGQLIVDGSPNPDIFNGQPTSATDESK
jgi:nitrite reductase (NO-forming)